MTSRWTRLWAAAGVLFVAAYIVILAVSGDNPDDTSSDHTITTWYASHSHRVRELVVFFVGAAGVFAFVWFLAHLRSLVRQAEGDGGRLATIVVASGSAFAALFCAMGALFAAPAFVRLDAGHRFVLDPNTFRLTQGIGALAFTAAFILLAPLCFAVGSVAWRTRMLPRWLAAASFVAGVAALFSAVWVPTFLVVLWILLLSGYLAFRPEPRAELVAISATA